MNMELFEFMQLLSKAIIKQTEERLWQQWLVDYGFRMDKEHFTSFKDYKKKAIKTKTENYSNLDKKKILEEAEKIKKLDQRGGSN